MTSPFQRYQQDLAQPDFVPDPAQERAVAALERLYQTLLAPKPKAETWFAGMMSLIKTPEPKAPVTGLYLWGGVGRGKTYLMDTFFEALPFERKRRIHFHRFMARVHNELNRLKGEANPLTQVAERLAQESDVLCFDEFYVSDITDAMLLGGLLEQLFARGVVLVATSNVEPDGLYPNGLQRTRFLPAIEQIKQHCQVMELDNGIDYRLRTLETAELYHYPLDQQATINLTHYFERLTTEAGQRSGHIEVLGRSIPIRRSADGVLWADFRALCDGPRSQNDYIELARLYHTVLLSDVLAMGTKASGDDIARRFIAMVDEFYERGVKLILSAEVPLPALYTDGLLQFEFQRCRSRLVEMQSQEYLAKPHLP